MPDAAPRNAILKLGGAATLLVQWRRHRDELLDFVGAAEHTAKRAPAEADAPWV